jgi:haloacetate dehalogenase
MLFDGFTHQRISTSLVEIALVSGGEGPPLLLLHGFPENHLAWHKIAPILARHFTVIAPDLPGYGDSTAPQPNSDHTAHSKRAFATILVEVMSRLGFEQFALVGHDRGGRVAYRLALDHPHRALRLAVLNIIPTLEMAARINCEDTFNWFFLAQPYPLPETLIAGAPDFYLDYIIQSWAGRADEIDPAPMQAYRKSFHKPGVIRAMCEEYRAGLSVDLEHDRADRQSGRRLECPVLVLWEPGLAQFNPLEIWRQWATQVTGQQINSGHFLMEEAPEETCNLLLDFLQ